MSIDKTDDSVDTDVHDPFSEGDLVASLTPTAPQHELWLASKVGGADANRAFNECLSLTMRGKLNVELLEDVLQVLMDRHEALRCSFTADGHRFTVVSSLRYPLTKSDLVELPEAARASALAEMLRMEVETPFDLERAPLIRTTLVRLEPNLHQLVFTAHHVVCDGWSVGVLIREMATLYRVGSQIWPTRIDAQAAGIGAATSFATYVAASGARSQSDEGIRDEAFWTARLAGDLKQIELPIDRARPPRRTYASRRIDLELDASLLAPWRRLGAKSGCTFLVTLMGAFQAWLYRLTGQRDLIVGMPAAGQAAVGADSLVGHCVHVLPIRMEVDPAVTLSAHLAAFKNVMLDALDAQQVTFSSLLRKLDLRFDPSRIPLIPVCINVDGGLGKLDFGGLQVSYESVPRAFESFELFINAVDYRDRLVIEWSYNAALFDEATIRRWMGEFERMIGDAIARPETAIKQLAVLTTGEIDLLRRLNATSRPLAGVPVHEQVAARAGERPEQTAIRFGDRTLSYRELDRQANQLAHRLRREGVGAGDCVGVYLERSEQLPIALLSVLRCGAAYVPMDPSYPPDRLTMMAEDGEVKIVVTESGLLPTLPKVNKSVCIDQLAQELAAEPAEAPGVAVRPHDRAYVLFTSGSTGRPKGVEVPHRALENFLASMQRAPGFSADDRLLAVTTVSFDIAGLELFLPLVTGGTVVLADRAEAADPEALARLLDRHDITVLQATPATWRMLIDSGWKGRPRLRVLCGGEALAPSLAAELSERAGEVWNMYGPTETTVWSTVKKMEPGARVTIGAPIDNTTVYVLDQNNMPVPIGGTGEIWIGGEGVALGYRGRPELTRERFVDDPFVKGARMYRTGDLGRVLPDGDLECLGRGDAQVKIRGFRIELGEIEAAIDRFEGIRKAVVQLVQLGQAPQLVAYWVADPGGNVEVAALKAHLQRTLPPYMLPQQFVALDAWPMTPAGKIDRRALPAPKSDKQASGEPLRDDVDVTISEIWQELLGVTDVGLGDDFFALGGQSLLAVRFVAAVKDRLGVPFNLATLFAASTLREVSDAIRSGGGHFDRGAVVLRREPGAPRVFFICGVHLYRDAALSLGDGFESYGVIVLGDELLETALRTKVIPKLDVPSLVDEYIAAIRQIQPQGPYHLAGVSFGGVLTFEIGRRLRAAGEKVDLLALLDPILPSAVQRGRLRQLHHFVKAEGIWNLGARMAKTLRHQFEKGDAAEEAGGGIDAQLSQLREEAYENAINHWDKIAEACDGDVVLFRASDTSDYPGVTLAPDLGWGRLVRGKLSIHDVPGTHIGMLSPPHVQRLAAVMRQYLSGQPPGDSPERTDEELQ